MVTYADYSVIDVSVVAGERSLDINSVIGGSLDHHVDVVKQTLLQENGIDPRKRGFVIVLLNKLSDRVAIAEQQRNEAVAGLASERERCQVSSTHY